MSSPALDRPRLSYARPMLCAFCRTETAYIHGHATCVSSARPMYGVNQAERCDGETAEAAPAQTWEIAAVPRGNATWGAQVSRHPRRSLDPGPRRLRAGRRQEENGPEASREQAGWRRG